MLNALKTPPLSHFKNEVEELKTGKVFKSKRTFFALFFVFLLVVVFSFFPNQNEKEESGTIASSEKSLVQPAAPPTKDQKTEPLPTQNKTEQAKLDPEKEQVQRERVSPFFHGDKKELTFKSDKEYLSMNRFERPLLEAKDPVITRESVRDTVIVVNKPLVFAGRGFDIKGFRSHARTAVQADFLRHLNKPVPKMDRVPQEHLDLQLTQVKSSKYLIFHPLRPALSVLQKPTLQENAEPQPKKPQVLQAIPETNLLLKESERSDLILRPGRESLDLMIGNEKINRKRYGSW